MKLNIENLFENKHYVLVIENNKLIDNVAVDIGPVGAYNLELFTINLCDLK